MIITFVLGCTANIPFSKMNAFSLIFGPPKLMRIISNAVKKNDQPMQIRNGISNPPLPLG